MVNPPNLGETNYDTTVNTPPNDEAVTLKLKSGPTDSTLTLEGVSRENAEIMRWLVSLSLDLIDIIGITGLEHSRRQQLLTKVMTAQTDMLSQIKVLREGDGIGILGTDDDEAKKARDSLNTSDIPQYRETIQTEKAGTEDLNRTTGSFGTQAQNSVQALTDAITAFLNTIQTANRSAKGG